MDKKFFHLLEQNGILLRKTLSCKAMFLEALL